MEEAEHSEDGTRSRGGAWSVSAGFGAAEGGRGGGRRAVENFWRTTAVVSPVQTAVFRHGAIKSPRARPGEGARFTLLSATRGRAFEWRSILSQESHGQRDECPRKFPRSFLPPPPPPPRIDFTGSSVVVVVLARSS